MKYTFDHDLHIHSKISLCSGDPEQTAENILQYAVENSLKTICLTDHFWDETTDGASDWYSRQNFAHIAAALPLPQADGVKFLFGCETELNSSLKLGITNERFELFDFIVIPTTHFHMKGYTLTKEETSSPESRAKAWVKRLDAVLGMDLPFYKVGIAHLTCPLIAPERKEYLKVIDLIPEREMERVFSVASELGVGIELNASDMSFADNEAQTVLRPYRIAKECGCRFYCGSDSHHPKEFLRTAEKFARAIEMLGLQEKDKFVLC